MNGGVSKPVPPPRDHLNRAPAPQIPDRKVLGAQQIGQILEPTPDQLDSIKKFQVRNLKTNATDIRTGMLFLVIGACGRKFM